MKPAISLFQSISDQGRKRQDRDQPFHHIRHWRGTNAGIKKTTSKFMNRVDFRI